MTFAKHRGQEQPHGTVRSIAKAKGELKTAIAKAESLKDSDEEFGRVMRTDVKRARQSLMTEVRLNKKRGK